ncbi:MAG: GNAT family N-acetyltransferase [Candidatus Cloacimonetes bacterium]|nr:GNAT family N-acetyltransferase [Candidatus Cloacimonadota bacterium]
MIEVLKVKTKSDLNKFIKFPFELYKNDPCWVPPLISDQKIFFDPKKNPYFKHSEVQLFLAYKADKLVGRISAQTNKNHNNVHKDKVGFFGFFECIDDQQVADALFDAARNWLKEKDLNIMRGPASFSVNDECGLLMDNFALSPVVMMTYNPQYYLKIFDNYGLEKAMDLLAYNAKVKPPPPRLKKLANKIEKRGQFTVRNLKTKNKKRLRKDIEKIFSIYEEAWSNNWGYVPMSAEEFDLLVDSLLPIILPEMIFIAEIEDEAVGLLVTIPDYNFVLKKMKGRMLPLGWLKFLLNKNRIPRLRVVIMGVLDEFKGRGIDVVMYCKIHEVAGKYKNKFKEAEFSWILESNSMMNKIAHTLEAEVYKTYRMFDIKI